MRYMMAQKSDEVRKKNGATPYEMKLCRVAAGDKDVELWNNEWLKPSLTKDLPCHEIVKQDVLEKATPIIEFRERRQYDAIAIL